MQRPVLWFPGVAVLLVALATPVGSSAQSVPVDRGTPPFPTAHEQRAADWVSTGMVAVLISMNTWDALHSDHKTRALLIEGARIGTTALSTEGLKRAIHRTRPDGSDHKSFPSGHTALAFSMVGGPQIAIKISLGSGTGALRVAANRHYLTDVLAGAGIGFAVNRFIK